MTTDETNPFRGDEIDQLMTVIGAEESDAEALARFVRGDNGGLAVLVERYHLTLIRVARRVLGNEHDAGDAVQAAWCSVIRRAAGFRGESTVSSWLWRIVRNESLDHLRRRITRPQPASRDATDVVDRLAGLAGERTEAHIVVDDLLGTLPAEQQEVVALVDLCGLSIREAANALGIAEGTVKSRRGRARAAMAALLGESRWL